MSGAESTIRSLKCGLPNGFNLLSHLLLLAMSLPLTTTLTSALTGARILGDCDPCSACALNAYEKCIMDNPCVCQNCQSNPSDPNWVITVPEPKSCVDISAIFCPLVKCCSPCEHILAYYHSCLAEEITNIYLGESNNCKLFECPGTSNDAECGRTLSLQNERGLAVQTFNPCQFQVSRYISCIAGSNECSECDPSAIAELHLRSTTDTCQEMNHDVLCPLQSCCPSCSIQLEAVASCVETNIANDDCPGEICPSSTHQSTPAGVSAVGATSNAEARRSASRSSSLWMLLLCSAITFLTAHF